MFYYISHSHSVNKIKNILFQQKGKFSGGHNICRCNALCNFFCSAATAELKCSLVLRKSQETKKMYKHLSKKASRGEKTEQINKNISKSSRWTELFTMLYFYTFYF